MDEEFVTMWKRFPQWFQAGQPHRVDQPTGGGTAPKTARSCEQCPRPQTLHITRLSQGSFRDEKHLCEECAKGFLYGTPLDEDNRPNDPRGPNQEKQIEIDMIIISEVHTPQVIRYREVGSPRHFHIMLGIFEVTAIDRTVKKLPSPRPLTYDAWLASLTALGAHVQAVCIQGLRDHTYYTNLRLLHGDQLIEVDMRPSDAVHLALKGGAPILVPERLLAEVCTSESSPS